MNIYTLHQEGSFRPPIDDEIPPNQSIRQQTQLHVVTEEKPTSVTSKTSGSGSGSSLGEKTTPRHNTRAVVSRIDATGVITNANTTHLMKSKAASYSEKKETQKLKNSRPPLTNVKRNGLIHIQAKDEFMIFEDNTDLVSHITTPSAVRTSPLENDFLVFDHDEFAEEEDLFSAITVPKALRKKRNKNKKRSKSKNSDAKKIDGKENIDAEGKNEVDENINRNSEQKDLKMVPSTSTADSEKQEKDLKTAPSTSTEDSEKQEKDLKKAPSTSTEDSEKQVKDIKKKAPSTSTEDSKKQVKDVKKAPSTSTEDSKKQVKDVKKTPSTSTEDSKKQKKRDEPHELPKSTPVIIRRQDSRDLRGSPSRKSSEHRSSSRGPDLRGGKRVQKKAGEAVDKMKTPVKQEDNDHTHGNDQEIKVKPEVYNSLDQKDEVEDERNDQGSEKNAVQQEALKSLPSVKTTENHKIVTPVPSPAISKPDFNGTTPEKEPQAEEQKSDYHENKYPKLDDMKSQSNSPARKKNIDGGINSQVTDEGVYGLDVTATTANLDTTNFESIIRKNSNESVDRVRKVPNSSKPRKWSKLLFLPTAHFCNGKKKKRHQMEEENPSQPLHLKAQ